MRLDTPVEEYKLNDRNILVKRDDLMGDGEILPLGERWQVLTPY